MVDLRDLPAMMERVQYGHDIKRSEHANTLKDTDV